MMDDKTKIVYSTQSNKMMISRHIKSGELIRIMYGVYASKSWYNLLNATEKHIELIKICVKLYPNVIIAGISAAVLHGMSILYPNESLLKVEAIAPNDIRTKRSNILHFYTGDVNNTMDITKINGILTQSRTDTLFFIMRHKSEAQSIVMLNAMLSKQKKDMISRKNSNGNKDSKDYNFSYPVFSYNAWQLREDLYKYINKYDGQRGINKAAHVLCASTDCAESAGESILLMYCTRFGFELPMCNISLVDASNHFLGRVDLLWNCAGSKIDRRILDGRLGGYKCKILKGRVHNGDTIAVEFDGYIKYENADMLAGRTTRQVINEEKQRENAIRKCGHKIVRVGWAEFYDPGTLYKKLKDSGIPKIWHAKAKLASIF